MIAETEKEAIKDCWKTYRSALLTCDGQLALSVVDSSTINYYDSIISAAKRAAKEAILELSLIEKFLVLSVRHRVPSEYAINMNGESFFSYGVDNGWIDSEEVNNTVLGPIELFRDAATARSIVIGEDEESDFRFIKEGKEWKIDISGIIPEGEQLLKQTKEGFNIESDEELIFLLLENGSHIEVSDNIWIPICHFT